jgi:pSer/pThr/pTyr-binding forkhead associated (FHA) protein
MSEFALTVLRLGFLALLWILIFSILVVMRKDLKVGRASSQRRDAVTPAQKSEPARKTKVSHLVVITEDDSVSEYTLTDGMIIGRGGKSSVIITDDYASTQHAQLSLTDKGWVYTDLGSTNGSWIDRKRINEPVRLKPNTEIRIGRTVMRFEK